MLDFNIGECTRRIPCVDCDNDKCILHGRKESDCPKWVCDRPGTDCETECDFIDEFIDAMRSRGNNDH